MIELLSNPKIILSICSLVLIGSAVCIFAVLVIINEMKRVVDILCKSAEYGFNLAKDDLEMERRSCTNPNCQRRTTLNEKVGQITDKIKQKPLTSCQGGNPGLDGFTEEIPQPIPAFPHSKPNGPTWHGRNKADHEIDNEHY